MELESEINAQKVEIEAQKQILTDLSPMPKTSSRKRRQVSSVPLMRTNEGNS